MAAKVKKKSQEKRDLPVDRLLGLVTEAGDTGELYLGVLFLQTVRPHFGVEQYVSLRVQTALSRPQLFNESVYHRGDLLLDRENILL
jgi:hypothetical protein